MAMPGSRQAQTLGLTRLAIGLGQGVVFWGLLRASLHKAWPATDPVLFAALCGAATFAPLIWMAGLGELRRWTLTAWLVVAAILGAGLAAYDVWRSADEAWRPYGREATVVPTFLATAAALFIGHHLIAATDEARRPIAPYRLYFDAAWKHAVQLALSFAFLGAFWLVLELGAALFALIGITALETWIHKPGIFLPLCGTVFAAGVHLTDVRATITRGLRTIGLMLLSWLMPLMGLLAAAFLLTLPFRGLDALWKVGHATALLLCASAALIVLLNAAYQDGTDEVKAPKLLKAAGRLTAVVLLPMAVLAGIGLWRRIAEHGLTPDRIIALGCLLAAVCYAVGYVIAAVRPGRWMRGLELANVIAAFVDLAVILALFTPIADPARISVASQVGRLQSRRIAPDAFDYSFLRFGAGRWGRDALKTLAKGGTGPHAAEIAQHAKEALKLENRWQLVVTPQRRPPQDAPLSQRVSMHPAGAQLPKSFMDQATSATISSSLSQCTPEAKCAVYVLDLGPQDRADVVIGHPWGQVAVFGQDAGGVWTERGNVFLVGCRPETEGLRKGDVRAVAPELSDLEIGGARYRIAAPTTCPDKGSIKPAPVSPAGAR